LGLKSAGHKLHNEMKNVSPKGVFFRFGSKEPVEVAAVRYASL